VKFTHTQHDDGHNLMTHDALSQELDVHQPFQDNNLHTLNTITKPTPYYSGHPVVDSIPHTELPPEQCMDIEMKLQTILGSLNWLSTQIVQI
jgi:hypothetical protein